MIRKETRDKIAELSAKPITQLISELVSREIEKSICARCNKVCDAPCPVVLKLQRRLQTMAWAGYAKMN